MKKLALILFASLAFALVAPAQIVITEIMYNPPESGTDSLEYIEIYNNSSSAVNLENWTLFGVTFTFPAVTINPGQYLVTAVNAGAMQRQFNVTALQWTGGGLNNSGEPVRILDAAANVIDEVTYANAAPWPTEAAGNGASLVLCDPNADNSLPTSWQAATTPTGLTIGGKAVFANPGAASGCATNVTAVDDAVVAISGQITTFNVLTNDILPGSGSPVLSLVNNPAHGTATLGAGNTINYQPNAGYCGTDELTYKVCENSDCDEAKVTITVRCYPKYSIDQINNINADGVADSVGIFCELSATVYGVNLRASATGQQFTMIDDQNNGITVFSATKSFGYTVKEKDKITVRGSINQFNGLIQIFPDTILKVSENNTLVTPLTVQNASENTESKLIRINKLRYIDPAQWATGTGTGFSVYMVSDDHPLDTIQVRIDNDVELFNQPAPPVPFDLTGIGGQFDNISPYTAGYQIAPRYNADISTLVGTKEADFSAQVRLWPNPVTDFLIVESDIAFDMLQLVSANGQVLRTQARPAQPELLPLRDLPAGIYFIRLVKDGAFGMTRFVKQ